MSCNHNIQAVCVIPHTSFSEPPNSYHRSASAHLSCEPISVELPVKVTDF